MIRRLVMLTCVVTFPLTAQQDSLMREAVRLATEGRTDSAHSIVLAQIQATSQMDPLFPEILYTGGVVSVNPGPAMVYFQRVAIEYSNSAWADRALLRIAQLSYASADLDATIRATDRILIDYPLSEIRADASLLAARAYLDKRDTETGCRLLDQARREAGENVEIGNQAAFYIQRCADVLASGDSTAPAPAPPTQGSSGGFTVQVAAVENAAAADELMRALQREGYDANVVREEGLLKVRVGRVPTRDEATELAATLRQQFGGRPFVVALQ